MGTDIVYKGTDGQVITSSLLVAETFGKHYYHVMDAIKNLLHSHEKSCQYYQSATYEDGSGKSNPMFIMNRDGFTLLAMGFNGKKALDFKIKYIEAFNSMEKQLQQVPQITSQFMETQMQLMQQMMNVCTCMMSRIEKLEQHQLYSLSPIQNSGVSPDAYGKKQRVQHRHLEEDDNSINEDLGYKGCFRPGKYSKHVFYSGEVLAYYPNFKKVRDVAKAFRAKGIPVHQKSFFRYLRAKGYLCSDASLYNRPSKSCEEKGYMVSVWSGPNKRRKPKLCSYVPYLSPEFVGLLESELRKELGVSGRQLALPLGIGSKNNK